MSATITTELKPDDQNLVWIDLEMTGLFPDRDRIIEIAIVVTDAQLGHRIEGPVLAVHQSDETLAGMDAWNTGTHGRSGLTDRVRASTIDEAEAERQVIEFLQRYVKKGASPMCGNSICQDRRFLAATMPKLEAYFHYRNLDVSTLKELARPLAARTSGRVQEGTGPHRACRHPGIDRRTGLLPRAFPHRAETRPSARSRRDVESKACRDAARSV